MEQKNKICEFCKLEATSLCFQCMSYFCDSCFKLGHKQEDYKSHKQEKIDINSPIDLKCPKHKLHPMDLFCVKKKGKKTKFYLSFNYRTLLSCCPYCSFKNMHQNQQIVDVISGYD